MLGEKHFLVAGGGGIAKTGVPNAIEVYELKLENKRCIAQRVEHYETTSGAIMNSAIFLQNNAHQLLAGIDGNCHTYTLHEKVVTLKEQNNASDTSADNVRKRKGNTTLSTPYNEATKVTKYVVDPGASIQTDFSDDGGFQKAVQVTSSASVLATGGADGFLRLWKTVTMDKLFEVKAHEGEIDDLDISPSALHVCTVSRDGAGCVWKTSDGEKHKDLIWAHNTNDKYRFRNCRYSIVIDKERKPVLFTTHIPAVRATSPLPCYITKWDVEGYTATRTMDAGKEVLSALAISDDGLYLAVGTISGSVSVYIAFSLQRLYNVSEIHGIFVTGLEFMSLSPTTKSITGDHDFSLLSVSADNTVRLHQVAARYMWSPLWALVGFVVIIYLFFWGLSAGGF